MIFMYIRVYMQAPAIITIFLNTFCYTGYFFNLLDSNPGRRTNTLQNVLPYCGRFFLRAFGSFQELEEYLQMECSGSSLRSVRSYFCDRDSCESQTKVCLPWWYLLMLNFCGPAVHYGDNVAAISSATLLASASNLGKKKLLLIFKRISS